MANNEFWLWKAAEVNKWFNVGLLWIMISDGFLYFWQKQGDYRMITSCFSDFRDQLHDT